MAIPIRQRYTLDEFQEYILKPENLHKTFEYIGGEIIEVPSNPFVSLIAGLILTAINNYLRQNDLGYATGEAGGYMVNGERYAPDVAFISYEKQPELARKGYNPNPPDLAVEVISDPNNGEEQAQLRLKLFNYLAVGVVVWVVNPHDRLVEIYNQREAITILDENGIINGGQVLPDFTLPVTDFMPRDRTQDGNKS